MIDQVRGVLVNYDFQMNIWNKLLADHTGEKTAKGYSLTLTNPLVTPQRSKEKLLEILFEYYGFSAVSIMPAAQALSYVDPNPLKLYVEVGNSATHITPVLGNSVSSHSESGGAKWSQEK